VLSGKKLLVSDFYSGGRERAKIRATNSRINWKVIRRVRHGGNVADLHHLAWL